MEKLRNFIKNNKLLIISLVAILVLSSFFREEIRTSRETLDKKETVISQLREELKQSELKIKELSESKEKEVEEVIIVNADGSSKTIKNTKSKSSKNSKSLESKETEKITEKKEERKTDIKITKEETIHKNPKKLDVYIGIDTNLDKFGGFRYNIYGPIKGGVQVNEKGTFGITLGWEF